jgi:hypothetical protein
VYDPDSLAFFIDGNTEPVGKPGWIGLVDRNATHADRLWHNRTAD